MNRNQTNEMEQALRNGNRFFTHYDDKDWNTLVEKGYAKKHRGCSESKAYYEVTEQGRQHMFLTRGVY